MRRFFTLQSHALDDDDDDDIHLAQEESASLTIADVNAMCEARITQVHEVVGLTHDMALIVLLSHEWNVDKCITELTEGQEGVLRQVWPRACVCWCLRWAHGVIDRTIAVQRRRGALQCTSVLCVLL